MKKIYLGLFLILLTLANLLFLNCDTEIQNIENIYVSSTIRVKDQNDSLLFVTSTTTKVKVSNEIQNIEYDDFYVNTVVDTVIDTLWKEVEVPVFNQIPVKTSRVISWLSNEENDLAGYRVMVGKDSLQMFWVNKPNTQLVYIDSLTNPAKYLVFLTAVDSAGNVSEPSDTVYTKIGKGIEGDLYNDGAFDIDDYTRLRALVELNLYHWVYDLNNDNKVDSLDLEMVKNENRNNSSR